MPSCYHHYCLLTDCIAVYSLEMSNYYEYYYSHSITCKIDLSTSYCLECTYLDHLCSLVRSKVECGFSFFYLFFIFLPFADHHVVEEQEYLYSATCKAKQDASATLQ